MSENSKKKAQEVFLPRLHFAVEQKFDLLKNFLVFSSKTNYF